jgi:hypothetical protein
VEYKLTIPISVVLALAKKTIIGVINMMMKNTSILALINAFLQKRMIINMAKKITKVIAIGSAVSVEDL